MKMSTRFRKLFAETVVFMRKERARLGFLLVSVLIGVIGFEVGVIRGSMASSDPIIIEKPVGEVAAEVAGTATEAPEASAPNAETVPGSAGCRFIGSRNSDLYHSPGCGAANRIKPENTVCFRDEAAAEASGYRPGCIR